MPGSHWKGVISFGLVSIPVLLYSAKNKTTEVSFHQIDKKNNARIHFKRINSVTGKEVPWENIIKGYEYEKDTIIPVPDEIIKKMAGKKSREIDIDSFISKQELNLLMLENVYYIVPEKKGHKAYVILENALSDTKKIGIAKVVISTKEYLAAIIPWKNALMLCLLKYPNEVKEPDDFDLPEKNISAHKIKPKEMQVAKQLINAMTTKWHPEKYTDEYKKSVHQWIKETVNHLPHKKAKKAERKTVAGANLIDLLKKSIATSAKKKKNGKQKITHAKSSHRSSHRRVVH